MPMKNVNHSSTWGYRLVFACIGDTYESIAYKKKFFYVEIKVIWDYTFL